MQTAHERHNVACIRYAMAQTGRMSTTEPPKAPTGLRAPGRRLWNRVLARYVLTESELSTLEQAARTADELDRLQLAVRKLPELTSVGSTGQTTIHPLLAAVDRHRRLLERLTAALNLPDDNQQVGLRADPDMHATP
jgi:hypothetical protein